MIEDFEKRSEIAFNPKDYSNGKAMINSLFPKGDQQVLSSPDSSINIIPSDEKVPCSRVLLVAIGHNDDCEKRLLEAIECVSSICPGKTRYVIFYAASWETRAWQNHLQSPKRHGCSVLLKLIGQSVIMLR
jgi:hypothetical protein